MILGMINITKKIEENKEIRGDERKWVGKSILERCPGGIPL
jgi:hypothetical protein